MEQGSVQLLVGPRVNSSQRWIDDLGPRVALASKDYVGVLQINNLEKVGKQVSRQVTVTVDETKVFASTLREAYTCLLYTSRCV